MKTNNTPIGQQHILTHILLVITIIFIFTNYVFAQTETCSTGSTINNIGIVSQKKAITAQTFGLKYCLLINLNSPVKRTINSNSIQGTNDFLIQHAIWTTEEYGIDGWRIDTYSYNDLAFMNRCNKALTFLRYCELSRSSAEQAWHIEKLIVRETRMILYRLQKRFEWIKSATLVVFRIHRE